MAPARRRETVVVASAQNIRGDSTVVLKTWNVSKLSPRGMAFYVKVAHLGASVEDGDVDVVSMQEVTEEGARDAIAHLTGVTRER